MIRFLTLSFLRSAWECKSCRSAAFAVLFLASVSHSQTTLSTNPLNEPLGDPGVIPVAADGNPLNLNFESGTLDGWTIEGKAFEGQPIKGDISELRPADRKKSEHTGQFWIGGFEKLRDLPMGTLTSPTFEVTHPYASFLIGGGSSRQTRVDIVTADDNRAFYGATGQNQENLRPVIVDLQPIKSRKIFIRIIDQGTGGWGHVNFDDFRFHSTRPRFKSLASELPTPAATALYPHAGLSPEEAAKNMVVPPGFSVQVAAAEPDVQQPVAMAIDDRGRIWIAEALQYPRRASGDKGPDRILVFEDTDLNGTLDKRTVFYEGLNLVSGLEVGFGGVWVGAAPYLYFIPDKDGDDKPDSEPVKLLDGWGFEDTHETLNSFIWGPDGWLYGCHGVFTHSKVGKPGTPDDKRVPLNAGIWRYHPVRHEFEVFAHGTSNPWGLDYDQYGNFFATACVIPHIFHIIPGARYERQAGQHFNPYTYDDIKTIADHRHYTGNQWNDGNRLQSDTLGGGHAHAGCMIYQGGAWPEKYKGAVFMNNVHGNRMNVDLLEPHGSGFVAHHGQDFLLTRDQWSQMLDMDYGPDGQVWAIDWYDRQQCHLREPDKHDRSNGRIFRIVYDNAKPVKVDLQKLSDVELVKLLAHENEWYVRHAQRILQERGAQGAAKEVSSAFFPSGDNNLQEAQQIRTSWAIGVVRGFFTDLARSNNRPTGKALYGDLAARFKDKKYLRSWFATLMLDSTQVPQEFAADFLNAMARDGSTIERLYVAAAAQRIGPDHRWNIVESLSNHPEDATDHNLPLMYWYAMEPLADVDPPRALALALAAGENIPILKEFMIRRIGAGDPEKSLALLVDGLKAAKDDATRLTFLRGLNESLKGRRGLSAPKAWSDVTAELAKAAGPEVQFETTLLAVNFGDQTASQSLTSVVLDAKAASARRRQAITALARAQSPSLLPTLLTLLTAGDLRPDALRALATFDDPRVPPAILGVYGELTPTERRDALATLCSRPTYAVALLNAMAAGKVPTNHLTADLITNLRNLSDPALNKRIEQVWGLVRSSPAEKTKLIDDYKHLLLSSPEPRTLNPEPSLGRAVFAKTCQQCHTLFGAGSKVGPDITGSQRANLDYVLSNILDPSAVMAKEYQPTIVRTTDGRIVTGVLKEETPAAISLQTQNELVVISKADIDESNLSDKSMMPDDLLKPLTQTEVRSLIAYLAAPAQSPMLATVDNIGNFFNSKDLTGWRGEEKLWSVENGEIVGKTTGLKKNEFLMSELSIGDFRLELEVKLVDDKGNSGIQIRSQPIENGLMRGYQCDIGPGWWGKLYEEHGRGLLSSQHAPRAEAQGGSAPRAEPNATPTRSVSEGGEQHVKKGDWNKYEIVAAGSRVRTWINGHLCVDRDDPLAARNGLIGLQLHSGGETEVRYRNLKLTLLPTHIPARPYPASKVVGTLRVPSPENQPEASARDLLGAGRPQLGAGLPTPPPQKITFKKTTLDRAFRSEGVGIGDFNNDGLLDISAGSVWYEQPESAVGNALRGVPRATDSPGPWKMHLIADKPNSFDIKTYGDTFMNWAEDLDNDGRQDLIVVDFPGKQTWWFQNPGPANATAVGNALRGVPSAGLPWKKHVIVPVTNNESPQFADVDGDGRRELIYGDASKRLALARPQSNPLIEWRATHVAAPGDVNMVNFYHGLGIGDINKDGRNDILVPNGWWKAPVGNALRGVPGATNDPWAFHPAPFGQPQAQMYVYDFDADGDNDVVGSSAHKRGIWWYEQSVGNALRGVPSEPASGGRPEPASGGRKPTESWQTHLIDDSIAQTHALILADINGDGLPDLVTGKRYYAHNGRDPGEDEPPEIAWFELSRSRLPGGTSVPTWTKHLIDSDSGVGTQFEVHDMNADGLLDVVVANKHGVFYFEQDRK